MTLYECMFLVEAGRASRHWEETEKELTGILEKHGAEIRRQTFYGERKLAYPVKKHRRGAYLLTYFEADPAVIEELRRDLTLSEAALRYLILKVEDGVVPEERSLGTWEPTARPQPAAAPETAPEPEAKAAPEPEAAPEEAEAAGGGEAEAAAEAGPGEADAKEEE